jgi:hypothetical protein
VRNSARPPIRQQVHPRALEILNPFFKVQEGYDVNGVPHYTGVPTEVWSNLRINHRKLYDELLTILQSDYPSFAALVQKIWAKKVGHRIPFIFNRTQLLEWNRIAYRIEKQQALLIAILKARQLGMSTLINGMAHWQVWRLKDVECNLFVHEKPLAYSFIDRLRIFHDELPKVPGLERHLRAQAANARVPKDELYYSETLSKVTTIVVEKNTQARGRSALHNHLAEYAFYPSAATLLGSLMPQLPPAGSSARLQCSVVIESTPNGKNDFYGVWQMAKSEESEWHADFFPWMVAEDEYSITPPHGWKQTDEQREWARNLAHIRKGIDGIDTITPAQVYWYEQTLATECEGDQDVMDREYPSDDETCFLLRSRSIFKHDMRYLNATVLEAERRAPAEFAKRQILCTRSFLRGRMEYTPPPSPFGNRPMTIEQLMLKPTFVEDPTGHLIIWEPPQPEHAYVCGIDAASGLMESDNSVNCILDATTGRQVGEYCGQVGAEQLADDSCAIGWFYNTAWLYPEINSIGVVTMKRLKQVWMYPHLGREEKWDEVGLKINKFGHYTTHDQKVVMVSFMVNVVRNHYLAIASQALLGEMSTYVQTKTPEGMDKFEADANNKDDRVSALGLALLCIRQSPKLLMKFTDDRRRIPTAVESMINDAIVPNAAATVKAFMEIPTGEAREGLPQAVKEALWGGGILGVPWNPISPGIEVPY